MPRERRDMVESAAITLISARCGIPPDDLRKDLVRAVELALGCLPAAGPIVSELDKTTLAAVRWLLLGQLTGHPEQGRLLERWARFSERREGGGVSS